MQLYKWGLVCTLKIKDKYLGTSAKFKRFVQANGKIWSMHENKMLGDHESSHVIPKTKYCRMGGGRKLVLLEFSSDPGRNGSPNIKSKA